jgi:hypothetical protein
MPEAGIALTLRRRELAERRGFGAPMIQWDADAVSDF